MTATEIQDDRAGQDSRSGTPRWLLHAVAGALLLASTSWLVGLDGHFFIDEAAMYAQMEVMEQGDWTVPRPFADVDDGLQHVPMANAYVTDDGYAPFVGHPLHVAVAFGLHQLVGDVAMRLVSALGVLGAAAGAAALADRRSPATGVVAFWLTLLASPLLFHSQLVLAHGPGAALATALLLAMSSIRRTPRRIVAVSAITAAGVLFRSEFLLFGGAVALVYGVEALRRRRPTDLVTAGFVAVSTVVTYRLEPRLVEGLVGGEAAARGLPSTSGARDGPGEVLVGARRAVLDLGGGPDEVLGRMTLIAAVVLAVAAIASTLSRAPDRGITRLMSFGALAAAAIHLTDVHLVRGVFWAFPALLLLLPVLLRRLPVPPDEARRLLAVAVFALFVTITQYSGGGGPEWGWRYTAIAIPAVTPTLARALVWLWHRAPTVPRDASAALAASFVLVTASSLLVVDEQLGATASFVNAVERVVQDSEADFVVFTDPSFGRFAYTVTIEGVVAPVAPRNSSTFLRTVADAGADRVLLVWRDDEPERLPLGPFARTDERYPIDGRYEALVLTRR